jgi:hypothetical protein
MASTMQAMISRQRAAVAPLTRQHGMLITKAAPARRLAALPPNVLMQLAERTGSVDAPVEYAVVA